MTQAKVVRTKAPATAVAENAMLQKVLDNEKNIGGYDGKMSEATARLIQAAETTDTLAWQIEWSNASIAKRTEVAVASLEHTHGRAARLNLTDPAQRDQLEAVCDWIVGKRCPGYLNYLNRRGSGRHGQERRPLPARRADATSDLDWEAVVESKLIFAFMPNLNPKEAIGGALHASA